MSPFELLGLVDDADERAIKRAYAQRLRVTRPEDDPEGFQRLHAAYQAALEYCRDAATEQSTPPHATVYEQPASIPPLSETFNTATWTSNRAAAEPPAPPRFNLDTFCSTAFELAADGDAAALQEWLESRQELWSLQLKARTGYYLVKELHEQTPPMPADCMETLLHFFDLDHALTDHDPLALQQLKLRSRLAWQLELTDQAVLASRLAIRSPLQQRRAHWIVQLLKRPFSWPRALFVGMNIDNAGLIADFFLTISENYLEELPVSIDRRHLNFWLGAAEKHKITSQRIALVAARSGVMLVLAVMLAPWLSRAFTGSVTLRSILTVIGVAMIPSAAWALWAAWLQFNRWHTRAEPSSTNRSPRACLIPAICVIAIIFSACGQEGAGLALSIPALWLAARRYWYQHGNRHAFFGSGYVRLALLAAVPVLHAVLSTMLGNDFISLGEVIAAAAMMVWAADLRKQRQARAG